MGLDVARQSGAGLDTRVQHDEGLDPLAALGVRYADRSGQADGRVP
jgi:hypothetical protein